MEFWILNYIMSFVVSAVLTAVIIPRIILMAFRRNLFDSVNDRKIHQGVVPRLGGVAFLPAIAVAMCVVTGVSMLWCGPDMAGAVMAGFTELVFGFAAVLLMFITGVADDLGGVRYRLKFLMQVVSGLLLAAGGLWIGNLDGFLWIEGVAPWLGWLMTVFLTVYVVNAVNLIDGIDGLASGLTAIAMIFYSVLLLGSGHGLLASLAAASLGTLGVFFLFNVFGNPARHRKIFMGDTGSLTIGVILVFLSLEVLAVRQPGGWQREHSRFILAFAPLLLPCFDVVRVFMRRVRSGRNPFLPDRIHIHHKLLALGQGQRRALVTILACDALLIALNLWLSAWVQPTWLVAGDVAVWSVANVWLTRAIRRREKLTGQSLYN